MLPIRKPGARSLADVLPNSVLSMDRPGGPLDLGAAESAVVVLVDGLGSAQLRERSGHARFLSSHVGESISTVFPSTTASALTTFATGAEPGVHGLVGYRVLDEVNDRVVNQLTGWDAQMTPSWQRAPTVFERSRADGIRSYAVGPRSFERSGFTAAVLRGAEYRSADTLAARFAEAALLARTPRTLVYLYVPELDKAAHRYGWESDEWLAWLEAFDSELRTAMGSFPPGAGVLVTADHGCLDVPHRSQILFDAVPGLIENVMHVGGEPRCLQLYLDRGATREDRERLASAWHDSEGGRAWVMTREEAIAGDLFGDVDREVVPRIGDVIVAARKRVVYYDGRAEEQSARNMIGQHGSLTPEETLVPLARLGAYAS
ncbi:alkaline phosphatase family protein [Okibacterium endophyticum]